MQAAMVLFAALCIGLGVFPGPLYALLPFPVDYVPYSGSHVVFQLQLLLFSGLAFFLLLGWLKRTLTITLDVDWIYRGFGRALFRNLNLWGDIVWQELSRLAARATAALLAGVYRYHGPHGALARTWPTGAMAFWTTMMLAAFLILSYV
jgi:multicomponent Na+:H+ antiporter subunit D